MIKQIKDLSAASVSDLNQNCQFVIDDSNAKTKKVSFGNIESKISSDLNIPTKVSQLTIDKLSAESPLPVGQSLDGKSLIMTDATKSYNVNYSTLKESIIADSIFDIIYPIGSVYISMSSTIPSTFKGNWINIGAGKCLFGAKSTAQIGNEIAPGLPNITGNTVAAKQVSETYYTGAFYKGDLGAGYPSDNDSKFSLIQFDASRSNSIYGNSTTVQPPAIAVTFWQRVASNVYIVTFKDYNGNTLKIDYVEKGKNAVAPETDGLHNNMTFSHWDKTFDNITANTTVTAIWSYTVTVNVGTNSYGTVTFLSTTASSVTKTLYTNQAIGNSLPVTITPTAETTSYVYEANYMNQLTTTALTKYPITSHGNRTLTVNITRYKPYVTLTVKPNYTSRGTVAIEGKSSTTESIRFNEDVTVVATPNDGYEFTKWESYSTNPVYSFNMRQFADTASETLTATFVSV